MGSVGTEMWEQTDGIVAAGKEANEDAGRDGWTGERGGEEGQVERRLVRNGGSGLAGGT